MSHPLQYPHSTVRRTDAGAAGCVGPAFGQCLRPVTGPRGLQKS